MASVAITTHNLYPCGVQQTRGARLNGLPKHGESERVWDTSQQASPAGRGNECNDIPIACDNGRRVKI